MICMNKSAAPYAWTPSLPFPSQAKPKLSPLPYSSLMIGQPYISEKKRFSMEMVLAPRVLKLEGVMSSDEQ